MKTVTVNGKAFDVISLLCKGERSYSFLVQPHNIPHRRYVLKQMFYQPDVLHRVGAYTQDEITSYRRLSELGIHVPAMMDVDFTEERIIKEYIDGPTVYSLILNDQMEDRYIEQAREINKKLAARHVGINFFPTNFVVGDGRLYYIDYECREYDPEHDFENESLVYWSKSPELLEYIDTHEIIST